MNQYIVLAAQTVPEFVNGLVSSYHTYKHYEYEAMRLEVEIVRIKSQTKVVLKQIDSDLKVRQAELKNIRLQMKQEHEVWMSVQQQASQNGDLITQGLLEMTKELTSASADRIEALQWAIQLLHQQLNQNSLQRHESLMQIAHTAQLRLDVDLKRLT